MGRLAFRNAFGSSVLAVGAAVLAGSAFAGSLGTPTGPGVHVTPRAITIPAAATPVQVYTSASYGTGGVGMRNRQAGMILVSGVTGKIKGAWLYFSYLLPAGATAPTTLSLKLTRVSPGGTPNSTTLTGVLLTTAGDPCWGSGGEAVYRAPVPVTIAKANGTYQVNFSTVESATPKGADPWLGATFPAGEGASLVIIGTGTQTVAVYDAFAATAPGGSFSYTLTLPSAASGGVFNFDSLGADGQAGHSRTDDSSTSGETTTVNGVQIAGPGAPFTGNVDSDWNGGSSRPIPQLWDDTGHNIQAAVQAGATELNVTINSPGDCITPIANVIGY